MQHKKIDFSKQSKLNSVASAFDADSSLEIISEDKKHRSLSVRCRPIDLERLDEALQKANAANNTIDFNRSDLIKGLIMMSQKASAKQLLDAIRGAL